MLHCQMDKGTRFLLKLPPLYPFQREGVIAIEQFDGRALLADSPGLGKTLQSLTWCKWHPEVRPIVIICPAGIKLQWTSEAKKWYGWHTDILTSQKPPKTSLEIYPNIAIINPEILQYWVAYLQEMKPQVVIVDESHGFTNPIAARTKALVELCEGVPHLIFISGTPFCNRPNEIWTILHLLLAGKRLPKRYRWFEKCVRYHRRYGELFCNPTLSNGRWLYKGATRLPKLHDALLNTCMIRRLKEDVLEDLPPKRIIVQALEIGSRKEYLEELKKLIYWWDKESKYESNSTRVISARAKTQKILMQVAQLKLPAIIEWVNNYLEETDEGLMIAALHRKVIRQLREEYSGRSLVIDGSVPPKDRQPIIDLFEAKKKYRLLICNIKAGGVGFSVKNKTADIATIELWWNAAVHDQMIDRIHGIGRGIKGRVTTGYFLIARGTLEDSLLKMIQQKQSIFSGAIDGKESGHSYDLFDQLLNSARRELR